mmetsp:Transcript_76701/g.150377  ORF Transcript_76701/g.150377 Transcript_76701/m.150377 type:complete len:341 (-) Transcript_76701:124-1146(-)
MAAAHRLLSFAAIFSTVASWNLPALAGTSVHTRFTEGSTQRTGHLNPTFGHRSSARHVLQASSSGDDGGGGRSTLLANLPSINQIIYGGIFASSIAGLAKALFLVVSGGAADVNVGDTVVKAVLLAVSGVFLSKSVAKVDYASLDGFDANPPSLGYEAGEWALAGNVPTHTKDGQYEVATFAGGCFWGTELHFQRVPGVVATCVGYTQGAVEAPNYEAVCSGGTGHTEALFLCFDPKVVPYEALVEKLFGLVDPTLLNRVGNDQGTQYRHGVYTHSAGQAQTAQAALEAQRAKYGESKAVVTEVKAAAVFYPAEGYHQQYLAKGGQSCEKNAEEPVRCYG